MNWGRFLGSRTPFLRVLKLNVFKCVKTEDAEKDEKT